MIRVFFGAAVAAGAAVALWVAATHAGSHPAILPVLALILAAFFVGVRELYRFRQHTAALTDALRAAEQTPPGSIETWLAPLPQELHSAVLARLAGHRAGLPGPALAPYLTGLLVLLGLLGTFLGMVATLSGTVSALSTSPDLQTIRTALALPVQGLGLAFGTSVAGVATSAALGLMAALARTERAHASRCLDHALHTSLRHHTEAARQERQWDALQASVTAVLGRTHTALERTCQQLDGLPQTLSDGLQTVAGRLEGAVNRAAHQLHEGLRQGLGQGAADMRAAVQPLVQDSLRELSAQWVLAAEQSHQALEHRAEQAAHAQQSAVQQWLAAQHTGAQALHAELQRNTLEAQATLVEQAAATNATLLEQASATHTTIIEQTQRLVRQQLDTLEQRLFGWAEETRAVQRQTEREWGVFAAQSLQSLEDQAARTAEREARDAGERQRLLSAVDTLMAALQRTTSEQAQTLDTLLGTAADQLQRSAQQFEAQAGDVAKRLSQITVEAATTTQVLSTLGEGFTQALTGFAQVNADLGAQLHRIETALGAHLERSDEQLGYYVAQARELVELTMGAQQQLLESLRRASLASARSAAEAV